MFGALRKHLMRWAAPRRSRWEARKAYLHELASRLGAENALLGDIGLVAWDRLEHAYGRATDVPDCLCIVARGSDEECEDAQCELESNLYHQGTLYPATPFAVPFLIRLASAEKVADRRWLLEYLVILAKASDRVHGIPPPGTPTVLEAVSCGLPAYRSLADSSDDRTREAAATLIASCVETSLSTEWWREASF